MGKTSKSVSAQALKIINAYIKLANRLGFHPSRSDLINIGISLDTIRWHFGNFSALKELVVKNYSKSLTSVIDPEFFKNEKLAAIKKDIQTHKKFVITTAVTGCSVDKNFYKSIKNYCNKNKAKLLILLSSDPGSKINVAIDPVIRNEHIVFSDVSLNSNFFISTIKLTAKQIDPVTSLSRIGQRSGSFVYASPKQRLLTAPTSNEKMPHVLMTTGAITKSEYLPRKYMNARTSYIAHHDHVMGAIVVEIENDNIYHYRQVQSNSKGEFVDLGLCYSESRVTKMSPEAFVLGDSHVTETDESAEKAWEEVFEDTECKDVILHDMFSGVSINHHEEHNKINRARLAMENKLSLMDELKEVGKFIDKWTSKARRVIIVDSNHHDFLSKHYLQKGKYIEDPQNHYLGCLLAVAMLEGKNPLQYAMEKIVKIKNPEKVLWLKRDQDYKIAGIELGCHGDKGSNGSRGSLRAMENAYGNSVSGHAHTPMILRGAWQVGTSSHLKLDYNQGPSSWLHTSCLVYKNGSRQLINSIRGQWRIR